MTENNSSGHLLSARSILLIAAFPLLFLFFFTSFAQKPPWVAPADASNVKNPLPDATTGLVEAKNIYTANCVPCHGDKGRGDGVAAAGLNPKPADHTSVAVQSESDGALFWKLATGRAPMPGYKAIFSETQRWELVNYIRTLAKNRKK